MALLDNIPGFKVFSVGIGLAALALIGWLVWSHFFKAPNDLKTLQREALEDALDKLSEHYTDVIRTRGEQRLVVMPVLGDTTNGEIRTRTIARLNEVAGLKAIKPPDPDLEERATGIFKSVLGKQTPDDPQKVFEKASEADEVIQITATPKSGADSGKCTLDVMRIVRAPDKDRKASVADPLVITGLSGSARITEEEKSSGPGFWASTWGVIWRLLIVLAATAIVPFASWPASKFVFSRDSNWANGLLLLALTLLDVAVLFATVAFELSTAVVICALVLLPVAGFVNLRVLNAIEENK
jgi:hypothetical protein